VQRPENAEEEAAALAELNKRELAELTGAATPEDVGAPDDAEPEPPDWSPTLERCAGPRVCLSVCMSVSCH
jgi:hypothetical protein